MKPHPLYMPFTEQEKADLLVEFQREAYVLDARVEEMACAIKKEMGLHASADRSDTLERLNHQKQILIGEIKIAGNEISYNIDHAKKSPPPSCWPSGQAQMQEFVNCVLLIFSSFPLLSSTLILFPYSPFPIASGGTYALFALNKTYKAMMKHLKEDRHLEIHDRLMRELDQQHGLVASLPSRFSSLNPSLPEACRPATPAPSTTMPEAWPQA